MNLLGAARLVLAKDLRIERRTREIVTTTGLFAVLILVLASLAFYLDPVSARSLAPGAGPDDAQGVPRADEDAVHAEASREEVLPGAGFQAQALGLEVGGDAGLRAPVEPLVGQRPGRELEIGARRAHAHACR